MVGHQLVVSPAQVVTVEGVAADPARHGGAHLHMQWSAAWRRTGLHPSPGYHMCHSVSTRKRIQKLPRIAVFCAKKLEKTNKNGFSMFQFREKTEINCLKYPQSQKCEKNSKKLNYDTYDDSSLVDCIQIVLRLCNPYRFETLVSSSSAVHLSRIT